MKKYTSILLVSLLAVGLGGVAHAEDVAVTLEADATVNVKPELKVAPAKARVEAVKAKAEARETALEAKMEVKADARAEAVKAKAEVRAENTAEMKAKLKLRTDAIKKEKKARLDEAKKTRVETAARVSVRVLTNALNRVQDLAFRAQTFAEKLNARGVATVEATAKLGEAKASWDAAKVKVDGLEADLALAVASETPLAAFETFRTHASEAKASIKAAHGQVVEAIALLKASIPAPAAAATVETSATVEAAQ